VGLSYRRTAVVELKDEDWIRQSFLIPMYEFDEQESARRVLSEANFKFTDTTLGGNFAINPPPQFCRFADIRIDSRFSDSAGMGRYYSEALDDRGQFIHLRFGVPQFNSLTNFFGNFYNPESSSLANRGRAPSAFYYMGKAVGFILALPMMPLIWLGQAYRFFTNKPASRFYYLKPAMPLYWSAVANIVNVIGVNMGVISRGISEPEQKLREFDPSDGIPEMHKLHHGSLKNIYPNIFREDGGVDIFAMAGRAQRLAHQNRVNLEKAINNSSSNKDLAEAVRAYSTGKMDRDEPPTLQDALERYHKGPATTPPTESTVESQASAPCGETGTDSSKTKIDGEATGDSFENITKDDPSFVDYIVNELEDGTAFVTFRVDEVGTVQESFSNSVTESQIAGLINQTSASNRSARFTIAGGNVGDGPIASTIQSALGAVGDFAVGVLNEVKLSGLMALAGSAFVDIPKVWESSTANLPSASYTIELRSPYGTPFARFQNLIVPLAMILAGALPLAAGKQSYTSPFLCELYCKGRNQIRLGMIESLSITRGAGNLGWTTRGEPLGIDISFTVVDLSTVMHMPITSNFGLVGAAANYVGGPVADFANAVASSNFDDDNAFSDYMAVLGSLGLADQVYPQNKLRLRKAQRAASWEQWKSPARMANWMFGNHPAYLPKLLGYLWSDTFGSGGTVRQ
jgi:hypothetical protein